MQSWLASMLYGWVEEVTNADGIRVLMGLTAAGVAAVVWQLARPANGLLVRVAIAGATIAVGSTQWAERPLLLGLLAFGLTALAAEGDLDARWLLPVGWLWVNSHGSFPLGIVYLVVLMVGRRLDGDVGVIERRAFVWLASGVALGAVNPLGPRILLFPLELLQRQEILRYVTEWQSPAFLSGGERLFLAQVLLGVFALVARPRRRDALVFAVFVAAALLGARNIAVASIALVPIVARAWPDVGSLRGDARNGAARLLAALGLVVGAVFAVSRLGDPSFDLAEYPVRSIDYLEEQQVDLEQVRMASIERVGNYLDLRFGPGRRVFYDDRFDMFPVELSNDVFRLFRGARGSDAVLDRWDIDLVLWPGDSALANALTIDSGWRVLRDDDGWRLFCRRSAGLGGDLGSC